MCKRSVICLVLGCLLWIVLPRISTAEHRVALIMINHEYQGQPKLDSPLNTVRQAFEAKGFRCQVVENLESEYAFRSCIETFATKTPTCSTAVIYYFGRTQGESELLATDSRRKYSALKMLAVLATRGGSKRNLIFFDTPAKVKIDKPPTSCEVFNGVTDSLLKKMSHHKNLVTKASVAVSPPSQFVPGTKAGDEWVNEMGIVFCWCPPGKYIAGSPQGLPGRFPDEQQREVFIKTGFWLSKYELAFGQPVSKRRAGRATIARHKLDPMTMINHDDAKSMTRNLTVSEQKAKRLPVGWQYTLPTEDQWEYAARAGTTTRFYFGEDLEQLPEHANFADKSYYESGDIYSNEAHRTLDDGADQLSRVGSYRPNPWGFHDMYGNVAEWCINLAIRGGGWVSVPENCRSAYRDSFRSRNEQNFIGYRLVIQQVRDSK